MSLILDALRKLEREKSARDPGVLVVGSVPWGGTSPIRRLLLAAGAAAALGFAVFVGWLLRPAAPSPAATAVPAAAPPTAEPRMLPSPTPLPPATVPPAAARYDRPPALPVRLSRPVPLPGAHAAATPAPTPAAPVTEPEAAGPEPLAPAESISLSPTAAAVTEPAAAAAAPAAPLAPGELRLTAISRRDGRPVALINDRLVFEGDSFEGVRVIRIGEAEVEVEVRGERRVLRF